MDGLSQYHKEERPWGDFERFTLNEASTVKIITVHAGEAFSLQKHGVRQEFWRILAGSGTVHVGDNEQQALPGDNFMIRQGEIHRATGGPGGLQFLEIAFGEFDEADIIRLEDKYGRM